MMLLLEIAKPVVGALPFLLLYAWAVSVVAALQRLPDGPALGASDAPGIPSTAYWVKAPERVMATLGFIQFLSLLGAGYFCAKVQIDFELPWPLFALAYIVPVFGFVLSELVPRRIAGGHALVWARWMMPVVRLAVWLLWPAVRPARLIARGVTLPLGGAAAYVSPDAVGHMVMMARHDAHGEPDEDLLLSILEFSDTIIREIMVPRIQMVTISLPSDSAEIRRTAIEAGHSRIPVFEDTMDNIVGVLHVKDLFKFVFRADGRGDAIGDGPVFDLRGFLRPSFYVPEVMQISELLREFQKRKTHMAIVVDEYGGTAGVVTLEDVIEEIVGEIQDEYDFEETQYRVVGDSKVIADARVNLRELEEVLRVTFPEDGGFETLAGFLVSSLGCLPRAGSVFEWSGLKFVVKEADEKRITTVEIERPPREEATS